MTVHSDREDTSMQLKEKLINKSEYEHICKQACENLYAGGFAGEETVLFAICRDVYDFFGEEFVLEPVRHEERLEFYWMKLLQFLSTKQSEKFSVLEITEECINKALNNRTTKR